jgi:hypothetical protein
VSDALFSREIFDHHKNIHGVCIHQRSRPLVLWEKTFYTCSSWNWVLSGMSSGLLCPSLLLFIIIFSSISREVCSFQVIFESSLFWRAFSTRFLTFSTWRTHTDEICP